MERGTFLSKILITPDSFKGSATSRQVSNALARGWQEVRGDDLIECVPFADGGEGTLDCFAEVVDSAIRVPIRVQGATGTEHGATWLLVNGDTAVIEMAALCGVTTSDELDPLGAHSFGLGQAINCALGDLRVNEILVAVGGSASTDCGIGALTALGFNFFDKDGAAVTLGGGSLQSIQSITRPQDLYSPLRGIKVLVDVQSPLVGLTGAAHVFGPQKGADTGQVELLDNGLSHLLEVTGVTDRPGFGAAGGVSFGLSTFLGATIVSGVEMIADLIGLEEKIKASDCIITGEGSFDSQSLKGKAVGKVMEMAAHHDRPLLIVCGINKNELSEKTISLVDLAPDFNSAMSQCEHWIYEAGRELAANFNY